jgi:hypothetical protein
MGLIILFHLFFSVIITIFVCLGINNVFAHIAYENKTLATIQEWKNGFSLAIVRQSKYS